MNFKINLKNIIHRISLKSILILFILLTLFISVQVIIASLNNGLYTRYNNYIIFKNSFNHLLNNTNLYILYPAEHYDLFKYSPSFAFFMGIFYILPNWLGVFIFNILGIFLLLYGIKKLNFKPASLKIIYVFIFIETGISLTSTQTNIHIVGLILILFSMLENKRFFLAALLISICFYIKIYGLLTGLIFLCYSERIKLILYTICWLIIIAILPLFVINIDQLITQYNQWFSLLKFDISNSLGASIQQIIIHDFNINIAKNVILLVGFILLVLPLLRKKLYTNLHFKMYFLSSILIWMVIFNYKAESPTYIIAMVGVMLFYTNTNKNFYLNTLIWLCLIFTSFSSTDLITPSWIINKYIEPLGIKALFPAIIWIYNTYILLRFPTTYFETKNAII